MITAFGGGGGAFGGDSLGRGGGSGSGSTGDGGRSARWLRCDGDSPNLEGIHDESGSSSWPCSGDEARGGRSRSRALSLACRSRALSLACATAVDRERPSTNVLLLGELLLPRPLGESQRSWCWCCSSSTIRASEPRLFRLRGVTQRTLTSRKAGNARSMPFFVSVLSTTYHLLTYRCASPRIFTP